MNKKTLLIAAAALLMVSTAAATSVQSDIENPGFSEVTWTDKWIPDFGGFLAVTAGQTDAQASPQHDNEIVVGETAQFRASDICVGGANLPLIGGSTVQNVGVGFAVTPENGGDTVNFIAKEPGYAAQVYSGTCYDWKMNNVYVPEKAMSEGFGEYKFHARMITEVDGETRWLKGEGDTGTITLKPKLVEEEDLRADVRINPSTQDDLGDRGERTLVEAGEEITFSATNQQGQIGEINWDLMDIGDSPNRIYSEDGESFTYTFPEGAEGPYSAQIRLQHEYSGDSWATGNSFYVQSQETPPPEARIDASDTSVTEGDTVTLSLDQSTAPESEIRHYSWSTGNNEMVIQRTFTEPGTYSIEGYVTNEEGKESSDSVTISVESDGQEDRDEPNSNIGESIDDESETTSDVEQYPPQIVSINAPGTVSKGEEFSVDVEATHRADDPGLEYEWDFGDTGSSATHQIDTTGTYTIGVTVTDSSGDTATDTTSVLVQENVPDVATPPPSPNVSEGSNLELFFNGQVRTAVQTSSFLNFMSVASQPESVDPNTAVRQSLSVSADTQPMKDLENGEVRKIMVRSAVIEDGEASYSTGWQEVSQSSYEKTFDREFETNGNKAYFLVMAEATSEFDFQQEEWSEYDVSSLDQKDYIFKVEGADQDYSSDEEADTLNTQTIGLIAVLALLGLTVFVYFARKD